MQRLRQRRFDVGSFVPTLRLSHSGDTATTTATESGRHNLPTLRLSLRRQGERTSGHRRGFHRHHPVFSVYHPWHHLLHLHGVGAVLLRLWSEGMTVPPNKIAGANAGWRLQFAGKLQVVLCHRPGVAQLRRWALFLKL